MMNATDLIMASDKFLARFGFQPGDTARLEVVGEAARILRNGKEVWTGTVTELRAADSRARRA